MSYIPNCHNYFHIERPSDTVCKEIVKYNNIQEPVSRDIPSVKRALSLVCEVAQTPLAPPPSHVGPSPSPRPGLARHALPAARNKSGPSMSPGRIHGPDAVCAGAHGDRVFPPSPLLHMEVNLEGSSESSSLCNAPARCLPDLLGCMYLCVCVQVPRIAMDSTSLF